MTDHIVLQGVSARGFHGVLDVEKAEGQEFVVDVTLEVDLRRAGRSDLLAHTVSYAEVAADVVALITGPSLDLIETLADRIAAAALRRPLVQAVEVTVHKPQAPVGVPFGDVQVVVDRPRGQPRRCPGHAGGCRSSPGQG
jgi:dihydroneopterin aldolase/2-amino-4-hydroxy-6-hydroxymethyldihydropteridine diphosphokinase